MTLRLIFRLGCLQMNKYHRSEQNEAARTRRWLRTKRPQAVKWIVDEKTQKVVMPCAWYAISKIAPANGISCGLRYATQGNDRRWYAIAIAHKGHGKYARSQAGAASSIDKQLALCFAYRNAIRQLLPQTPNEQMAYSETQANAIRKYA